MLNKEQIFLEKNIKTIDMKDIYEKFNICKKAQIHSETKNKLRPHNNLLRQMKNKNDLYFHKKNGQWGYIINLDFGYVVEYMIDNNLKTLVDLGSGEGHVIELLNDMGMGFTAKGYEIEEVLIEEYKKNFGRNNIVQKDIMKLTSDDIKDFEVIYFYQPFRDRKLMKDFLIHLYNIMMPNQIVIYVKDNVKYLEDNPTLAEISNTKSENNNEVLEIFKKL